MIVNLSIYRNAGEAATRSQRFVRVDRSLALFVGEEVAGPASIVYEVPPLEAGTNYVQSDSLPDFLHLTLVVS